MGLESVVKVVATAGTALPLTAARTICSAYIVRAMEDNTGNAYVGGTAGKDIDNTVGDLQPGESISWQGGMGESEDLNQIYVDVDTGGEGVDIWYIPA